MLITKSKVFPVSVALALQPHNPLPLLLKSSFTFMMLYSVPLYRTSVVFVRSFFQISVKCDQRARLLFQTTGVKMFPSVLFCLSSAFNNVRLHKAALHE